MAPRMEMRKRLRKVAGKRGYRIVHLPKWIQDDYYGVPKQVQYRKAKNILHRIKKFERNEFGGER